jgi:hypothetical protein
MTVTSDEVEAMLRLAVHNKLYNTLKLISGNAEPWVKTSWQDTGVLIFEIEDFRVEVDIAVRPVNA